MGGLGAGGQLQAAPPRARQCLCLQNVAPQSACHFKHPMLPEKFQRDCALTWGRASPSPPLHTHLLLETNTSFSLSWILADKQKDASAQRACQEGKWAHAPITSGGTVWISVPRGSHQVTNLCAYETPRGQLPVSDDRWMSRYTRYSLERV